MLIFFAMASIFLNKIIASETHISDQNNHEIKTEESILQDRNLIRDSPGLGLKGTMNCNVEYRNTSIFGDIYGHNNHSNGLMGSEHIVKDVMLLENLPLLSNPLFENQNIDPNIGTMTNESVLGSLSNNNVTVFSKNFFEDDKRNEYFTAKFSFDYYTDHYKIIPFYCPDISDDPATPCDLNHTPEQSLETEKKEYHLGDCRAMSKLEYKRISEKFNAEFDEIFSEFILYDKKCFNPKNTKRLIKFLSYKVSIFKKEKNVSRTEFKSSYPFISEDVLVLRNLVEEMLLRFGKGRELANIFNDMCSEFEKVMDDFIKFRQQRDSTKSFTFRKDVKKIMLRITAFFLSHMRRNEHVFTDRYYSFYKDFANKLNKSKRRKRKYFKRSSHSTIIRILESVSKKMFLIDS